MKPLHKKGDAYTLSRNTSELFVSLLLIGVMAILLRTYFTPTIHETQSLVDPELNYQIWAERLLNNCFSHQDHELQRTYIGVDLNRFHLQELNTCFSKKIPFAGIRVTNLNTQEDQTLLEVTPNYRTFYTQLYKDQTKQPARLTLYLK